MGWERLDGNFAFDVVEVAVRVALIPGTGHHPTTEANFGDFDAGGFWKTIFHWQGAAKQGCTRASVYQGWTECLERSHEFVNEFGGAIVLESEANMKKLLLIIAATAVLGFAAQPAQAGVHIGIGIGVPGFYGGYYPGYAYGPGYYPYGYPYYGYYPGPNIYVGAGYYPWYHGYWRGGYYGGYRGGYSGGYRGGYSSGYRGGYSGASHHR